MVEGHKAVVAGTVNRPGVRLVLQRRSRSTGPTLRRTGNQAHFRP